VVNGREVSSREVSLAEAKAIKGLRAVFGEVRGLFGLRHGLQHLPNNMCASCGCMRYLHVYLTQCVWQLWRIT
jgi:hypothetical protein